MQPASDMPAPMYSYRLARQPLYKKLILQKVETINNQTTTKQPSTTLLCCTLNFLNLSLGPMLIANDNDTS